MWQPDYYQLSKRFILVLKLTLGVDRQSGSVAHNKMLILSCPPAFKAKFSKAD